MEIWKDIKGYEGLYEVSNLGRARSLYYAGNKREEPLIMTLHIQKNGYAYISLYKDKKPTVRRFHRVVAEAFLDNPYNLPYINHKDENKSNNSVDNLEWCTAKYNTNYGTCIKRIVNKNSIPINKYTLDGCYIKTYSSIHEAAREEQLSIGNICSVCRGNRNHTGGYIWKYAKKGE